MTVKEMIEVLKRMNPKQKVVVAIDDDTTQYIDVDCVAQTTKFVVLEITY